MQEMCNNTKEKMITVKSSDGEEFVVAEAVARMCTPIRHMIEDERADGIIPLPNVTSKILTKAIVYCKMHVYKKEGADLDTASIASARTLTEEEMQKWDKEFINVDLNTLYDLIWAANYLEIDGLLHLTCRRVAEHMSGKTPEEIREHFHIVNDYTPEEEEKVRREHSWALDPEEEEEEDEEEKVRREHSWALDPEEEEEEEEEEE